MSGSGAQERIRCTGMDQVDEHEGSKCGRSNNLR